MPPVKPIVYADIQAYLEAIADNPDDRNNVDFSRHGRFWTKTRDQFVSDTVPGEACGGQPIPIVDQDPAKCPFFIALTSRTGFCNLGQMPRGGPAKAFITDPNYKVTLKDGTTI